MITKEVGEFYPKHAHERAEAAENGSTRDHCTRWPAEVNGEGHAFESHKPANSPVWVRRCSFCGWVDGAEIAAELREAGWVDPEEAARLRTERADLVATNEDGAEKWLVLAAERDALLPVVEAAREWRVHFGNLNVRAPEETTLAAAVDALDSGTRRSAPMGDLTDEERYTAFMSYELGVDEGYRKAIADLRDVSDRTSVDTGKPAIWVAFASAADFLESRLGEQP